MRQRRVPIARHAAIAGIACIGIERLSGLVHGILELAADREGDVVDAHLRHAEGDALRVGQAVAVLDRLVGEEAHADREIGPHAGAHLEHDLPKRRRRPSRVRPSYSSRRGLCRERNEDSV